MCHAHYCMRAHHCRLATRRTQRNPQTVSSWSLFDKLHPTAKTDPSELPWRCLQLKRQCSSNNECQHFLSFFPPQGRTPLSHVVVVMKRFYQLHRRCTNSCLRVSPDRTKKLLMLLKTRPDIIVVLYAQRDLEHVLTWPMSCALQPSVTYGSCNID